MELTTFEARFEYTDEKGEKQTKSYLWENALPLRKGASADAEQAAVKAAVKALAATIEDKKEFYIREEFLA